MPHTANGYRIHQRAESQKRDSIADAYADPIGERFDYAAYSFGAAPMLPRETVLSGGRGHPEPRPDDIVVNQARQEAPPSRGTHLVCSQMTDGRS